MAKDSLSTRISWRSLITGICFGSVIGFSFSYLGTVTSLPPVKRDKLSENGAQTQERLAQIQREMVKLTKLKKEVEYLRDIERDLKLLAKDRQKVAKGNDNGEPDKEFDQEEKLDEQLEELKKELGEKENEVKYFNDASLHKTDDRTVADQLYNKVRVLCWVMTQPKNLETRSRHIQNTWGKRCNKILFFSSVGNDTFPTIGLGTGESRNDLQAKTSKAFRYIYEHHYDDYDWFMRTDDDAYVILENLRYFLSGQDTMGSYYFGHHFRVLVKGGYFSGGPGIVIGKKALKLFFEQSIDRKKCRENGGADDVEFGKCLYNMGIYAGNSSDSLGRNRFFCFDPGTHLMGGYPDWFLKYDANGAKYGISAMSDYAIGFHYVNPTKIYELEWFVYHLRPYGIIQGNHDLNQPIKNAKSNLPLTRR